MKSKKRSYLLGLVVLMVSLVAGLIAVNNSSSIKAEEAEVTPSVSVTGEVDISQYDASQIANVSDWAGFARAFANKNIAVINITQSFAIPDRPLDGLTDVVRRDNSNVSGTSRYVPVV